MIGTTTKSDVVQSLLQAADLLTPAMVSQRVGVSLPCVRRAIASGELPHKPHGAWHLVTVTDADEWAPVARARKQKHMPKRHKENK